MCLSNVRFLDLNFVPNFRLPEIKLDILYLYLTLNPYEDSYGIDYGDHDGFTYNTTISSAMPTREYSSCMRLSAKSTSIKGLGDKTGYHYPHFEIMYNSSTGEYEKNCVLQINAYNKPRHCNEDTLSW